MKIIKTAQYMTMKMDKKKLGKNILFLYKYIENEDYLILGESLFRDDEIDKELIEKVIDNMKLIIDKMAQHYDQDFPISIPEIRDVQNKLRDLLYENIN